MNKAISIYDAKTHLSKLVKQAQAGKTIYIGAYGQPQAILAPLPVNKKVKIGVWAHKAIPNAYKDEDIIGPDPDIIKMFEDSANRPFPE